MVSPRHSSFDSARLPWVFPLTYLLHIAEEYWGGYPAHLLRVYGVDLSIKRFLLLQSIGILLMVVGVVLARRLRFTHFLLIMLAAVFLSNALIHTTRSIMAVSYEPGLLSSLILWLPLGIATLVQLPARMSRRRYLLSVICGVIISAVVELITFRS